MPEPSVWMKRALAEAERAVHVSPNPGVGCVIVRDGTLIAGGYTRPGGPHAEADALRNAGGRAAGADVFVTLEPCSHWGRTPPCADALVDARVARVHCSLADPDPRVRGSGIARLRAAGIEVSVGDGHDEAVRQLAAYLTHRSTGRPMVIAKFAASLDGKIATRSGDSQWISGKEARAWTRAAREHLDAILVGAGTVLADDPQLTARTPEGSLAPHQPLRVALDSRGRTPLDARVLSPEARTLVVTTERSAPQWQEGVQSRGAELLLLSATEEGHVPLPPVLDELGRRRILSLLVEGGGAVHGAFFDEQLVDRVQAILSPLVIGGAAAPTAVGGIGPARLVDASRLLAPEVRRLGDDLLIEGALRPVPLPA